MSKYEVTVLPPAEYDRWDDFLTSTPGGSVYSSSTWLEMIARLFNRELKIWTVQQKGEIVAGVGTVSFHPAPLIKMAGFLPLTPYNSVVIRPRSSDKEAKAAYYRITILSLLAEALENEADVINLTHHPSLVDMRPFIWRGWKSDVRYTYLIDVSNPEILWHDLHNDFRTQVRKCQRNNVTFDVVCDGTSLYWLYHHTYEKHGRKVYIDEATFCEWCNVLLEKNRLAIYTASLDGQPISGVGIIKDYRGMLHEWVAGTDTEFLNLGVASFMLWKAIEELSREGYTCLDLNGANVAGIARHKSKLGGVLTPYYRVTSQTQKSILFDRVWQVAQNWGVADFMKQKLLGSSHNQ